MRLIGHDVGVFSVDSNTPPSSSYLTTLKEVSLDFSLDMAENRALKDRAHYNEDIGEDWRVSFTLQPTDDAYPEVLTHAKNGTSVYVVGQTNAPAADKKAIKFSGLGVIRSVGIRIPRGAQELPFEVVPRGELTFTEITG